MKKAVAHLIPYIEEEKLIDAEAAAKLQCGSSCDGRSDADAWADEQAENDRQRTVLLATVKGDVHDIGKNIVAVVLRCNNYRVIDLGVMTPWERIAQVLDEEKIDILGLSGLITPSLDEMVYVARMMKRRNLSIPLLIGGATTSKLHTAVKIAPVYSPTVHVFDASRSVGVVSSLLDADLRDDFVDEINEEYEDIRDDYYDSQADRSYVPYKCAQQLSFANTLTPGDFMPVKPAHMGVTKFLKYPLRALIDYIDWNPFFATWSLRGKYPNRGYPKLFDDPTVGKQAKELFDDATNMLKEIMDNEFIEARGVIGFFPAASTGEDIDVYSATNNPQKIGTFYGLRQQVEKHTENATYTSIADFVAPAQNAKPVDYIGMFAVSAGFGVDALVKLYELDDDDYKSIMVKALADRLAEAFAEKLHEEVRTKYWGYASDETLSTKDLHKVQYQGIRPAPGYPMQPDHTEKKLMWQLMEADQRVGITLTESMMMNPPASVSGLYFAHPKSHYFSLGKISKKQLESYASRKGWTLETAERWLKQNINYDPDQNDAATTSTSTNS
mmetsp:Transcript_18755/g.27926  ORF Transcript_18755/g.27926 Transcript_18755/m.27926 type:complete len:556 (+) Transcript_18755:3-1670(+)